MKDGIVNHLARDMIQRLLFDQQAFFQRYLKLLCARNSIKLRPKLRPYSLPPRSLSQNRYSLPTATSITATTALLQITALPLRSTPEPGTKLTDLLRVTPLRLTSIAASINSSTSPRKSQVPPALPPPPPPPPPTERIPTSLIIDRRNAQQISLIGTAVVNSPSSQLLVTTSTLQTSQNPLRQIPSAHRYRSATTINTTVPNSEVNTRLPPINIERLISNDQITINRSNTITTTMVESIPRAVSGTSIGSNLSSTTKLRTLSNAGKLQRPSRPVTTSLINHNTKDLNNSSSSVSPVRSITATTGPSSSSLRTTLASRAHHQQQKRPLVTTKAPPPPPPSGVIKVPAPHIW